MPFDINKDFFDPNPIWTWLFNLGSPKWWLARSPIVVNPVREDINMRHVIYKGNKRPVYGLYPIESPNNPQRQNPNAERLTLWYLPYNDNSAQYTILDPGQATIMVTAPMSGCTFGAGTATIKGEMIVTHTNASRAANPRMQSKAQAAYAKDTIRIEGRSISQGNLRPKLVEPKHYRTDRDTEILLFGIYSDGKSGFLGKGGGRKWRFYQHVYSRAEDFGNYTVLKYAERIFRIR